MHQLVIYVAKYLILVSGLVTLLVLDKQKRPQQWRLIATIIIGGVIAYLLAKIGSHLYYDPRPFIAGHFTPYFGHANDNGFPSDHTLLAGLLAFSAWYYCRKAGYVLLVLAILIGGARMIAGVHHSSDIVGALIFSAIGAAIAYWLVQIYATNVIGKTNRASKPSKPSKTS